MQREVQIVWNNCLRVIQEIVPDPSFKTWFEPIVPVRLAGNSLTIQVPSQFFYEHLEEKYVHLLRKAIDAELGPEGRLEYSIIVDKGNEKSRPKTINIPTSKSSSVQANGHEIHAEHMRSPFALKDLDSLQLDSYLNPHYTFDNYV